MVQKTKDEDAEWLVPLLGVLGLGGAVMASLLFNNNNNSNNNNTNLPPPPVGQKPSGCGCQHKKA